jgi:flagellar biosynthesis protein FlhA
MSAGDAAKTYTLLTIGDGLVAQIPALIISTAAGLVVTRVGDGRGHRPAVGRPGVRQPAGAGLTAAILGILGLIPGMPHFVFLLLAGWVGLALASSGSAAGARRPKPSPRAGRGRAENVAGASWSDVAPVDVLGWKSATA